MPRAQRRNRALESAPKTVIQSMVALLLDNNLTKSLSSNKLTETFIVSDELSQLVTPPFQEALNLMKSRSKEAEDLLKQLFITARQDLKSGKRTIQQILSATRRMLVPPITLTDATIVQQLSRRLKALSSDVIVPNEQLNALYIGNLDNKTVPRIRKLLPEEAQLDLQLTLKNLDDYIAMSNEVKAKSGRCKGLVGGGCR